MTIQSSSEISKFTYNLYFVILLTALKELALNKPAKQSTTYYTYSANLAVDGNKGTDFFVDKCSCTNVGDLHPWLSVDLQAVYNISSVRIFNRGMDVAKIGKRTKERHCKT